MRYRDYKEFRDNSIYHIFNRGNNKQLIFLDEQDYNQFLKRLCLCLGIVYDFRWQGFSLPSNTDRIRIKPLPKNSFSILVYCLMPNHFHFMIKQNSNIGIDRLILKLCTSYAIYFNRKYNRVGTAFQDAFKAKLVDNDAYAMRLSAYIHANPSKPFSYKYSSLSEYINGDKGITDTSFILSLFDNNRKKYQTYVEQYILSGEVLDDEGF